LHFNVVGGWIALSSEGYKVKHNLIAQAGVRVDGDVTVNGVIISRPVSNLQCNPSRRGALRWNDKFFEGCDGLTDWRPISFCSRSCDINTDSVPCGLPVRNRCDADCQQAGTGLNMRQCILRVAATPCNSPVVDLCGNACGLAGQLACDALPSNYGAVLIKSLAGVNATAAFQLSVGAADVNGTVVDPAALVLAHRDAGGVSEDLAVVRRFNESGAAGAELAAPPSRPDAVLRVSMLADLAGDLVQLGRAGGAAGGSHIFFDGLVDKVGTCPAKRTSGEVSMDPGQACAHIVDPPPHGLVRNMGGSRGGGGGRVCVCVCGRRLSFHGRVLVSIRFTHPIRADKDPLLSIARLSPFHFTRGDCFRVGCGVVGAPGRVRSARSCSAGAGATAT
jgi:hypothetical protein